MTSQKKCDVCFRLSFYRCTDTQSKHVAGAPRGRQGSDEALNCSAESALPPLGERERGKKPWFIGLSHLGNQG